MNISLSPFASENLVSRDRFSSPVARQPAHLHTQTEFGAYLRDSSRVPRRRPFIYLNRHMSSGQSRVYRVTQLRTDGNYAGTGAEFSAKMPPRPLQASDPAQVGQPHAPVDTRLAQAPPGGWTKPPDTWAAVTSRRPQPPPPTFQRTTPTLTSECRDNYGFPLPKRNSIFGLASAKYAALGDVGRSKASLRFTLDLALKTPSPLSREIANSILD